MKTLCHLFARFHVGRQQVDSEHPTTRSCSLTRLAECHFQLPVAVATVADPLKMSVEAVALVDVSKSLAPAALQSELP